MSAKVAAWERRQFTNLKLVALSASLANALAPLHEISKGFRYERHIAAKLVAPFDGTRGLKQLLCKEIAWRDGNGVEGSLVLAGECKVSWRRILGFFSGASERQHPVQASSVLKS